MNVGILEKYYNRKRHPNLLRELGNFKILHGKIFSVIPKINRVPKFSNDIHVVTISDQNINSNPHIKEYLNCPGKLNHTHISLSKFTCFIDKVLELLKFIKLINSKYVLYMDTSDTILISNILEPQMMLDLYEAKILFMAHPMYPAPDSPCKSHKCYELYDEYHGVSGGYYLKSLWNENFISRQEVVDSNKQKFYDQVNTKPYPRSLHAAIFMGERKFMITVLEDMFSIMNDNPIKGYPYGETDDQTVWQYMENKYGKAIGIDFLELFFIDLWESRLNFPPENPEHFNYVLNHIQSSGKQNE